MTPISTNARLKVTVETQELFLARLDNFIRTNIPQARLVLDGQEVAAPIVEDGKAVVELPFCEIKYARSVLEQLGYKLA